MEKKLQLDRLKQAAMARLGFDGHSDIAKLLGESPQTITNWESRGVSKSGLIKANLALGVSIEWIKSGLGEMFHENVHAYHPEDPVGDDEVRVAEYKVQFSAGNGRVHIELAEESEPASYRRSWFQRERINPDQARRFKVTGDSMEPLLYSGDSVLVNLAENEQIIDGCVYAIRYGDELRIKRLFKRLDGSLTLRSENSKYKDEDISPSLAAEHISIIGRVRDKSGKGGL